ncbi:Uncharacterized protein APZ42_025630 [Daphnia magna]|nr:Uncharacterized protein APZ42_025630 [Daphnia magna]
MQGVTFDSYGKESYGEVLGNTNKGSSYWISPEGQKFTLTWTADEAGFQPEGNLLEQFTIVVNSSTHQLPMVSSKHRRTEP